MSDPHRAGLDGGVTETLLRLGRYLRPRAGRDWVSTDLRALHRVGGRDADTFYRDLWSYDKVVRSTHGVNCTGSCSWKVYVKDGIITWESQQTDYPSVGPDRPEYEPRGCPRTRGGRPVHLAAGRRDAVVLRLVRRPAGRVPAGVRGPDRRAGVR